jgi:Flp pilus assembly protein TadG
MRRWLGLIGRFGRETEGAIMVEMAILTPILIALSAGVFTFGSVFYQKLLIEGGLDDAARYLARCHRVSEVTAGDNAVCDTNAKSIAVTADSGTAPLTDSTPAENDSA